MNIKEVFYIWILLSLVMACKPFEQQEASNDILPPSPNYPKTTPDMTGEQLAYVYCQACHAFPEPQLLPKHIWTNNVLPKMAIRLGVEKASFSVYPSMTKEEIINVLKAKTFASEPELSPEDWKKIIDFYKEKAPDSLLYKRDCAQVLPPDNFWDIDSITAGNTSLLGLLKSDEKGSDIYLGNLRSQLSILNKHFLLEDSLKFESPPIDVHLDKEGIYVLTTGAGSFNPSDRRLGNLFYLKNGDLVPDTLLNSLPRPVDFEVSDLNEDGQDDLVVCGFGHYTGWLAWYEKKEDGKFVRHVLRPKPGAIKAYIQDMNQDQLPDIVVLMAQGDEGVFIYYNEGEGAFREEQVLRFPPIWGSSYFELVDMDMDGDSDIVYTCGDNGDETPILKPYHGCRVFINDGKNHFDESYFFPIYGAFKAIPRDYDKDGDIDIATISFFPDSKKLPEEGFVYLENVSSQENDQINWQFEAKSFDFGAIGKWLVADAIDFDEDGDEDLLLSATPYSSQRLQMYYAYPTEGKVNILVLKNKMSSFTNE